MTWSMAVTVVLHVFYFLLCIQSVLYPTAKVG